MSPQPGIPHGTMQWLEARTVQGPTVLRNRVLEHSRVPSEAATIAEHLSLVAERVLAIVEEHPGDRTIALDLLAADALITLALLAQSEAAPEKLEAFAEGMLAAERLA